MSILNDYSNFSDLLQAGFSGDKSTFREELEVLQKQALANNDLSLVEVVKSYFSKNENAKIEDKTSGEDKAAAFNKTLSDVNDIPVGLLWVKTNVTMDQVILRDEVKEVIYEFLDEQDHNEKYILEGLEPRNKCMFIGPPGNGKTAISKAIANRVGCPMYFVRYDQLISQRPGETSKRLHEVFKFVKTHRCILFFDEMDAIGKERSDENESGDMKRAVSTLLVQLDDVPPHVIVLGATNHAGMLDKAIWRRFHVRVTLPSPTLEEYVSYLQMKFGQYGKSPERDLEVLAIRLKAENFAEVEVFVEDCIRKWIRSDKTLSIDDAVNEAIIAWPKTRVKIPT